MKNILGLDLGTTSIGWALVKESENDDENSSIVRTGVRVIPLTTDESTDFEKGKAISINADRTLKRGARRNLQRYKQRRNNLLEILKKNGLITEETILSENGKNTTHSLWKLRAKAATEEITLEEFARVLLSINKKRGYKSNRKAKDEGDGQSIDSMEIAMELYDRNLTPGQYVYELLQQDKKHIPDFYRSDLHAEFEKVWSYQKQFYSEILTNELQEQLKDKNKTQTWAICRDPFSIEGIKQTGSAKEKRLEIYGWRNSGLNEKLELEILAIVLQEINSQINNSSGYLGAISDRSKELHFNNQTVGQYLYKQLLANPHTRLKNQVFYRQDYLDEFEKIWEEQSKYNSNVLTEKLKNEIRDIVIFYQRRLKSQKGLISICELEGKEKEIVINGKKKRQTIGPRVIPKSSPLFQEFKIWQILNNLEIKNIKTKEKSYFDLETRKLIFEELNIKGKLSEKEVIKLVMKNPKGWELNYNNGVEGNRTNEALYKAYQNILILSGHDINISKKNASDIKDGISEVFNILGINKEILDFDAELHGKEFEQQLSYQLWHLLYSYEGDNSKTGNDKLFEKLKTKFGFEKVYARALVNIVFQDDYGSLSTKAIKKILPYMKQGYEYSEACEKAGYNHSHSVTKEENEKRQLKDKLDLLPKNSLRNPVVEKILNQMVNVINAIIDKYGKPDEIRIELARELKKSSKERSEMTNGIAKATREHDRIRKEIAELPPFNTGIRITRNDIIKYKLYEELSFNGHKTLYTNTYVPKEKLFSKEFDIEHIIPQATLFDDSFSNKTLSVRQVNLDKGNTTAYDFLSEKYGEESKAFKAYIQRVEKQYKDKKISKTKYNNLLMPGSKVPDGFIDRDLRNSQYIAKKAMQMLLEVIRNVTPTTGSITSKLRDDWQLVNVMQELNWQKYKKLGLIEYETNKDGNKVPKIIDWSKRNDHRHHAMDALTVAFTKLTHIQYFNYLNARRDETHKQHKNISGIEKKETLINDKNKRIVKPPIPIEEFRAEAKNHLENTLISFKAKNKVVTRNNNKTKKHGGFNNKTELTPRGQLHKETVYGKSRHYETKEEKIGPKFNEQTIAKVAKKKHRLALLKRLGEFENDPKKAFGGKNTLAKNPVYLDEFQLIKLPEKVTLVNFADRFTIRKGITPDLKIEKVVDKGIQNILQKRLNEYDGDRKKAFSNLEENPIWLNKDKNIQLKRVTITGVNKAEPLHYMKDHTGNDILDTESKQIPVDFVSTGNNHHIAIYKDKDGKLQEKAVSFYEAVMAKSQGLSIIDKLYNAHLGWKFLFTMKQNEYFVFPNQETGFIPNDIDLMDKSNYHLISPNLFRVQKIATKNYMFRHHLETSVEEKKDLRNQAYINIQSTAPLKNITKVSINHLGQIVKVGE